MVGPRGLEPQTSTVSKRRDYVLPTTYNAEETALVRASTAKTESLQVKLQVKKRSRRISRVTGPTSEIFDNGLASILLARGSDSAGLANGATDRR
jgi:hypothetical protein